jgi:tetratricopeptide (TPR) repeat protein
MSRVLREALLLAGPILLLIAADALVRDRSPREATDFFRSLARSFPESSSAWQNLGASAFDGGLDAEAEEAFTRALALSPDLDLSRAGAVHYAFKRGLHAVASGDLARAASAYLEALAVHPSSSRAGVASSSAPASPVIRYPSAAVLHSNLGGILAQQGRMAEALASFESALRSKPDLKEAWFGLGLLHLRAGRRPQAAGALSRVVALDPSDAEALRLLREASGR